MLYPMCERRKPRRRERMEDRQDEDACRDPIERLELHAGREFGRQ